MILPFNWRFNALLNSLKIPQMAPWFPRVFFYPQVAKKCEGGTNGGTNGGTKQHKKSNYKDYINQLNIKNRDKNGII